MEQRRKLVVIGDAGCGKTALVSVFAFGNFPLYLPAFSSTLEGEITIDGKLVRYALWDTSGTGDYELLRPLVYPGSHVIIIAFKIPNWISLQNVHTKWIKEVRKYCDSKVPIMLVGCKADLRPDWEHPDSPDNPCPWVTLDQGQRMAHFIGACAYMECSTRNMTGVSEVYEAAARAGMSTKTRGPDITLDRNCHCVVS